MKTPKDFPLLVAVDEETGEKFARMIGMKGIGQAGQQDWLVLEMSEALKTWGHAGGSAGKIILKSDGEKSISGIQDGRGEISRRSCDTRRVCYK